MQYCRLTDDHNATNKLFLYCDIHGHSRKHNYFMYGCGIKPEGDLSSQVFPLMLSYVSPKMVILFCFQVTTGSD